MDARVHRAATDAAEATPWRLTELLGVRLPRVAVVIGCYNQAAYVETAIRSVASQDYGNFECVVLDDNSADGSADRIGDALASLGDARFRTILRRENGGQMATMLEGLDATSSPFVAFLDADDFWHPEFLERHVRAHMSERGIAALSCSNLAIIDMDGTQLSGGKPNFIAADPRRLLSGVVAVEEALETEIRNFIAPAPSVGWIWSSTSAMMFRRTVLDVLRPARPERLRICADYHYAKGAHMLGGTVRIEQSLGAYRVHKSNGFARNKLLGDLSALGKPPDDIVLACNEEFVRCLCDRAEQLCTTLSPEYIAKLLVKHMGRKGAFALAATNPGARHILSTLPPPRPVTRLKRIKRRLKRWLRPSYGKTKPPG